MEPILLGDSAWSEDWANRLGKAACQILVEDENAVLHGYREILKDSPGLVRTPTYACNRAFLKAHDLEERIEAVTNIAVDSGRAALDALKQDTLLCGVIGPMPKDFEFEIDDLPRYAGDIAVYLIDKGVDCIQIEGFSWYTAFQKTVETVRRVNSAPIPMSAFFKLDDDLDVETYEQAWTLAVNLNLDLLGFELSLEQALKFPDRLGADLPMGFAINSLSGFDEAKQIEALTVLIECDPSLMLGGQGLSSDDWRSLKTLIEKIQAER